jgi:hypothetical protein
VVVALVGVQLRRPSAGSADRLSHRCDGVDELVEEEVVVAVGGRDEHGQGDPAAFGQGMDLRAGLAPVDGAGAGQVPLGPPGR